MSDLDRYVDAFIATVVMTGAVTIAALAVSCNIKVTEITSPTQTTLAGCLSDD
jgi:hypothetical protein